MREALNSNPLVQVGAIGVLAVLVGFLLLTRLSGSDSGSTEPPATAPASEAPESSASVETTETDGLSETTVELEGEAAAEAFDDVAGQVAAAGSFTAGPGLPKKVADAYRKGDTVALLITKERAMEDRAMRRLLSLVRDEGSDKLPKDVSVFTVKAKHIADYSRIARGVDVDRVPALIVLTARARNDGGLPTASINYGFRGPQSIAQAFNDAAYKGKKLPYHPE